MSLSNPYHWVSDLAPRTRRRIVLSAGAAMSLVAGLTLAAVLVPAGTGNAAPAPPDYVYGGGPCNSSTFYSYTGQEADGLPERYYRYQFLYSYEINGSPGTRYFRYVHAASTWSGTEWVGDPAGPTVQTWYCTTRSPVPATPTPTPTPSPTPDPTPTSTPSPTGSPDPGDCGDARPSAEDVQTFLANWSLTADQVAEVQADPCVLTRDWDAWIPAAGFNWSLTGSNANGELACGTFEWVGDMDLRWRGSGVGVDSPKVKVTQQNICWDRYKKELTNGAGAAPAAPTVEIVDAWRLFPLQVTKTGTGGSGVSTCALTGSVYGNRVEPTGAWTCTLEANITFGAGTAVGFLTSGGPWTTTTPALDFWRIPGAVVA